MVSNRTHQLVVSYLKMIKNPQGVPTYCDFSYINNGEVALGLLVNSPQSPSKVADIFEGMALDINKKIMHIHHPCQ